MSSGVSNSLNRNRMRQLLAAVGSEPAEEIAQTEAAEYNWNEPHYFSSSQLMKLDDFAETAAKAMATRFSDLCRSRFDVTIASITQHFASEFLSTASGDRQKDYFILFGVDAEHPCGFVGMPEETASAWAKQLLGDSGSETNSSSDLSPLEESLLLDLTGALVEAFSDCDAACSFCLTGSIVKGGRPLEQTGTDELCRISFDVKKTDSDESSAAYLLLPCRELDPVVGRKSRNADDFSANEISGAILDHLHDMTVSVSAQLASAKLTFGEIMNLQVNDMLLLDKAVNEPIDMIVDGQTFCNGRPAKSAGKYAVTVSAMAVGDTA